MHARSLFRILEAAVAASTLGGCCIGRSYGPSERDYLVRADPARGAARRDGTLPEAVCRDLCGPLVSEETLLGCWTATSEMTPKERPRRLTWAYREGDYGQWLNNSTMLSPERERELEGVDPAHVDPSVCLGFHSNKQGLYVKNCSLAVFTPPLPRGSPVVQCRKRREGGCDTSFGSGRDTRARRSPLRARPGVAGWLALAAASETTSVRAFAEMIEELGRFGAPRSLVRSAARARMDEGAHAALMTRLARARGAEPVRVAFVRRPPRSLEQFATENAVEGCVRELFGAAIALHQSRAATEELRAAFRFIARDETRHAALSLRTHRWCAARLDARARGKVAGAMREAIAKLLAGWPDAPPEVGFPEPAAAAATIARLDIEIWRKLVP